MDSKRSELIDLNDIVIDTSLSIEERKEQFLEQVGNPNLFRVGDIIIEVENIGERSFQEELLDELL